MSATPSSSRIWRRSESWPTRPRSCCRSPTFRPLARVCAAIQDRWAEIGHVPRADKAGIERRLQQVEQALRAAEDARWKRTNPEARARAAATVEQLMTSISKLEKERDTADRRRQAAGRGTSRSRDRCAPRVVGPGRDHPGRVQRIAALRVGDAVGVENPFDPTHRVQHVTQVTRLAHLEGEA